jgi:hypothetical protein
MYEVDTFIDEQKNLLDTGLYEECGWHAHVLIVADRSDAEFERFTLQVIKSLNSPGLAIVPNVGERFQYLRRRGFMCWGMPRLTKDHIGSV